ncbi:MAG: hypothetical protein JXB85_01490, partial [Anaerolineales bacterium]|nr:hypothetical protein [Anaerolineales bacterium]
QSWTSGYLGAGPHTIRIVHATGSLVDIDAVASLSDDIPPEAIDDLAAYLGSYGGNVDLYWTSPGDDGATGTASNYLVRYATTPIDSPAAWDAATPVTTGVPAPFSAGLSQSMTVTGLAPTITYYFSIRAQDEEPNISDLSNSPSATASLPVPLEVGTHDNTDLRIIYFGSWSSTSDPNLYGGSANSSTALASNVIFVIDGSQFSLVYTTLPTYGNLEIYVDDVLLLTINQSGPLAYQQSWASPNLGAGPHNIKLVHTAGTSIEVDAIIVNP